jgi:hypothetical protein
MPVILLYSNEKTKFPNGYAMRQVLAYKILDIILLISYRIGPEQTRIEMEPLIKAYFEGFNQVRTNVMNSLPSKNDSVTNESAQTPLHHQLNQPYQARSNLSRSAFKARTSIVLFNQNTVGGGNPRFLSGGNNNGEKDNLLLDSYANNSMSLNNGGEMNDDNDMNSFDEYLKFSYDQTTNEIVGSSLKSTNNGKREITMSASGGDQKYRSQSFGLLSLNSENDGKSLQKKTNTKFVNCIKKFIIKFIYLNKEGDLDANKNFQSKSPTEDGLTSNLKINDEILNTFSIELAHIAYLSISRLNSGCVTIINSFKFYKLNKYGLYKPKILYFNYFIQKKEFTSIRF